MASMSHFLVQNWQPLIEVLLEEMYTEASNPVIPRFMSHISDPDMTNLVFPRIHQRMNDQPKLDSAYSAPFCLASEVKVKNKRVFQQLLVSCLKGGPAVGNLTILAKLLQNLPVAFFLIRLCCHQFLEHERKLPEI